MTVNLLLELLHGHLDSLQVSTPAAPQRPSGAPVFFLDSVDTRALIDVLTKLRTPRVAVAGAAGGSWSPPSSSSKTA